ncbi:hypothetical protein ACLOJK_034721, partial [Asimina triloba]
VWFKLVRQVAGLDTKEGSTLTHGNPSIFLTPPSSAPPSASAAAHTSFQREQND